MAHKYYCTHCGRELNQEKVLFDMEPILTGGTDVHFNILTFRIDKAEFERILQTGVRTGDQDYVRCQVPFAKFAECLSDKNNLDDVVLKSLSLEEISEYLNDMRKAEFGDEDEPEDDMDFFGGFPGSFPGAAPGGMPGAVPGAEDPEPKDDEKALPATIEALYSKDKTNTDRDATMRFVVEDLDILHKLFSRTGTLVLELQPQYEKDDTDQNVLHGYDAKVGEDKKQISVEARVCCHCHRAVFEHAGTAEHRSVAFIGDQRSGKTSTILAMAHYAQNAVRGAMDDDPIWGGSKEIQGIVSIDLLNRDKELVNDLKRYANGVAPYKTNAVKGDDAYSATFRIRNKAQKFFILTLTDLPGELCDPETGKIDVDNILNNFPVAMACDVFLMCFDSTTAVQGKSMQMIKNVCAWADAFQLRRAKFREGEGSDKFAPLMVVFTKCKDLEEGSGALAEEKERKYSVDRIKDTYSLREEREYVDSNQVYRKLGELMKDYNSLNQAYFARLRCSPYGFAAPSELALRDDYRKLTPENSDAYLQEKGYLIEKESVNGYGGEENYYPVSADGSRIHPHPVHIDELLCWLLKVSGCIPTDASYCENPHLDDKRVYNPKDNYIVRPQYRTQKAAGAGKDGALNEALSRCYLFENPTSDDRHLVENYDNDGGNGGLGGIFGGIFGGKDKDEKPPKDKQPKKKFWEK